MKPAATLSGSPEFVWPLRVYWEDTDAGGIVFYANYLKFFERGRTEWLRSMGIGQQALREAHGGMFVVAQTQVRYHRAARLDDELHVSTHLQQRGRASLTLSQQVRLATGVATPADAALLCEGSIQIGWVDALSLKPARMPPTLLELIP